MEKLVLQMDVGDDYTWSATDTFPFEYSSKIEAEFELLRLWEEKREAYKVFNEYTRLNCPTNLRDEASFKKYRDNLPPIPYEDIKFAGLSLSYDYLTKCEDGVAQYDEPSIFTLEEWFETNKPKVV